MTQPHDEHDEHDPAAQERVRALLADLGSGGSQPPGPVPDDVAARLDATLAGLAPPRRRRDRRLLVAAAVAAVVGIGGVTTAGLVSGSQDESSSSAGGSSAESSTDSGADPGAASANAPELSRAGFAQEAPALVTDPDGRLATGRTQDEGGRSALATGCATPPGRGEVTAVLLDGEPAVLVARPVRDGRRLLQAWSCDAARVLASTRVAVPPS